jgi:hypothetical protein
MVAYQIAPHGLALLLDGKIRAIVDNKRQERSLSSMVKL